MTNKLMENNDKNNSFLELQNIINQAIAQQQEQIHRTIKKQQKQLEEHEERIALQDEENRQLRNVQLKEHRVKEHRYGYISAGDLGQLFLVSIGSKTMGKLLRVVGLAKKGQARTEPLRSAIIDDYAKSFMYGDFPSYQWNPERCISKIERWLNKKGLIDEFYSIEDEKELAQYINELYDTYE